MTSPLLPALIFLIALIVDYQPLQQKQVQCHKCIQLCLIKLQNKRMNAHNSRDHSESEDKAFLQNFQSMQQSPDFLQHLCNQQDQNSLKENIIVKQEMMAEQEGYEHVPSERKRSARSKEKKKIFYRDKMAELMKPGEYIKQQYNYVAYSQFQHQKIPISKDEQLKRNRESAKNSRQRKKQYVTILEQKNDENGKIIEELKSKLEQVTLQRDRLKQDNHQQIKNFLRSKAEAYQNLQKIINDQQSANEQIKKHIQFMLERFSASGSERVAVMNYYMNEIIEDLISDIHKYFLTSPGFTLGYSPSNPPRSVDLEVMTILDLDIAKMSHLTQKYKDRFSKQSSIFKTLTQDFYRVFKSIQNQSRVIEIVFADLIKEIDSRKIGELILWFQENKFCREIKRVRKDWIDQLKTGEEVIEIIRKQTKHN